jgi:outer membrane receptor for ferrienterochelin and colicin
MKPNLSALKLFFLAAFLSLFALTSPALADDTADEAELQFQLGAERYQASDFKGALEHFLQSNRLAPNRNVLFNIARAYEQLKQTPDAFRYYTQARDGETDAAVLRRIDDAVARISAGVAVLKIESDPPGATIYIDRKDLGARGNAPRALGLPAGKYKVIVELAGYERAESQPVDVQLGQSLPVKLKLKQILGGLRVEGDTIGAQIRLDREDGPVADSVPATINVPPGRHTVFVTKDGYKPVDLPVEVVANQVVTVRAKMEAQTGGVVVNADVREALVTIDGKPVGFTPTVLAVPIGRHRLQISQGGFRNYDQQIIVTTTEQVKVDAQLTTLEEVTAASRVTESVEDAPSSVTIINSQELRAMGYPTISEAVRGVRGLYLSDDRSYETIGFRGFGRPGDYGNRVLVLIDGHPANDNYIESSYVDFSGRVDLEDIERIEVVRGPGSVLYGSSAFFGVINLVTRSRNAPTHGEVGVSALQYGVGRARAMAHVNLGPDAGFWTSVSGAHGAGRDFYFQEFSGDPSTGGNARGVDGFDASTVHGRGWYKDFTLQWFLTSRKKNLPTGEYGTIFGNPSTHYSDTRGFLEGRYEPKVTDTVQLLSRAYANLYYFDDILPYLPSQGGNEHDSFRGTWVGGEQRVVWTPIVPIRVTIGGELQRHVRAEQSGSNDAGPLITATSPFRNDPFTVGALYGNVDYTATKAVKVVAGTRFDTYSNSSSALSPRLSFIFKPYDGGNVKVMAGRAFRAPSVYELFFRSGSQIRPDETGISLTPESIYSGELEYSHRFSNTVTGLLAGYTNYVTDLVVLRDVQSPSQQGVTVQQYQNSSNPILTVGGEAEVRREWRQGWMLSTSYSYQHSRYLNNDGTLREVPNSPEHLVAFKGAVPLIGRGLMAMTRITVEGPRYDGHDRVPAAGTYDPQTRTDPFVVWDLVFSGEAEKLGVRWNVGVYNVADAKYTTIPSVEFTQRQIVQNGRTFLASVNVIF